MAAPRKIFISYSHKDEAWKDRLLRYLNVLLRSNFDFWTSGLPDGAMVEEAIRQADLAVLLISPDYLASDFIRDKELPALLERRHKEGLAIVPIALRPSAWSTIPEITELHFGNDPTVPLEFLSEADIDRTLSDIALRIAELAEAVAQRSATPPTTARLASKKSRQGSAPPAGDQPYLFLSHSKDDGDFAELLKLRLEREGYVAWVDTDRLAPGLDWRQEIDKAIKDAKALIAIMSPQARASEYVTYEWAFAWGCGKKVIPIMLRETTLHPRLATLQYLDFTNRIARPWVRLLDTLNGTKDGAPMER
jgi:hypothetical protein